MDLFCKYSLGEGYEKEQKKAARSFGHYIDSMRKIYEGVDPKVIVTDYIAGMTDSYAQECIKEALGINLNFNF